MHDATNKAWVLKSGMFKLQIEDQTGHRKLSQMRGGDRKSEKKKKINYTDRFDCRPFDSLNFFYAA